MTVEEVEELGLERGAGPVGVEVREERIVGILEHHRGVETRAEPFCERRLAGADRAINGNVPKVHAGPMISSRRGAQDARLARVCGRTDGVGVREHTASTTRAA
jgi:hypothetical protein